MTSLLPMIALARAGRWDEAHQRVQRESSTAAAWLHGILHIQEGDLGNAEYWYDRAGRDFAARGSADDELAALEASLNDGLGDA